MAKSNYVLTVQCGDRTGIIYNITRVIFENDLNITRQDEFVDEDSEQFFLRAELSGNIDPIQIQDTIQEALPANSIVKLSEKRKKRIVILVTKEPHCIGDLLIRHSFGQLDATIEAVIGNHKVLQPLVERFDLPYHFVDHKGKSRKEHEEEVMAAIDQYEPEVIVLAKYMRILTPDFVKNYYHKVVNIHHSFLPAFIGANPYRQAFNRGVKIIGATAHFVTDNLDEGPIISQDVIKIDHRLSVKELSKAGKDVEKIVLAKALKLVFQDRVFINGNKTIIF